MISICLREARVGRKAILYPFYSNLSDHAVKNLHLITMTPRKCRSMFYLSMTKNDDIPFLSLSACISQKTRITNISLVSVRQRPETKEQFSNMVISGKILVNGLQSGFIMELMLPEEVSIPFFSQLTTEHNF